MSAVPQYATGVDFHSPSVRKDAFDVMARLVEHYRATSTDMVESQWREPVENYIDPELWKREVQAIHRTRPLPVALSCELPTAGSYKALDVVGTPVILTRERNGDVRALVRSEEHTSELQSLRHLVCRLLLEKKKKHTIIFLLYKIKNQHKILHD